MNEFSFCLIYFWWRETFDLTRRFGYAKADNIIYDVSWQYNVKVTTALCFKSFNLLLICFCINKRETEVEVLIYRKTHNIDHCKRSKFNKKKNFFFVLNKTKKHIRINQCYLNEFSYMHPIFKIIMWRKSTI